MEEEKTTDCESAENTEQSENAPSVKTKNEMAEGKKPENVQTQTELEKKQEKIEKKKQKKAKKTYSMTIPANKKGRHVMKFMNFLRVIFIPVYKLVFPYKCYGEKKTKDGPCVYVCNHFRIWDPVYIARTTSEGIHILAKREVTENWFLKGICKKIRVIAVNRDGNDARALMTSLKCLKNGEKVSLFPEGTRNKTTADMLPFKPGAAAMAIKARVPIVPIAIYEKAKPFRMAHILYGKPFELSEFYGKKLTEEDLKKADEIVENSIISLRREHAEYLQSKKKKKKNGESVCK